jgi:hypothetical protein
MGDRSRSASVKRERSRSRSASSEKGRSKSKSASRSSKRREKSRSKSRQSRDKSRSRSRYDLSRNILYSVNWFVKKICHIVWFKFIVPFHSAPRRGYQSVCFNAPDPVSDAFLFDPWIWDPGWVTNQDPDLGSGINISDHISKSLETIF